MHRKLLAGLGAAVVLLGMVGCSTSGIEGPKPTGSQQQGSQPDVSGVPDVVAEVNGVELTKDEFVELYEGQYQQMQQQSQTTGEEVDQDALRKQTADAMVDTELLIQESDARNIEATQEELDAALEKLATANQMKTADEALAALKEQGLDEKAVYSQLKTQVRLDKLIAQETGDIEPTDEELQKLYDQAVAQQKQSGGQGGELPSYEEARPQLVEQAKSQKQSEAYEVLVKKLRKGADITVNL
ncbi:SurA N-terminal domain-containing protein [Paramicrobacterium fandaimingii]|uniref:SurA N-terminal domain-containing protein n=1 Tax=Paramicrobacterium fandaimingii TaxID=2708079 RepID=UPI0014216187|nr:SurA N-terminal domain-containing protein [Microbacterium fandaimingii]